MTCITHVPCHARIIIISPSLCSLLPCSSAAGAPPSVNHPASQHRTGPVCFAEVRGPRHKCSHAHKVSSQGHGHSVQCSRSLSGVETCMMFTKDSFTSCQMSVTSLRLTPVWNSPSSSHLTQRHPTIPTRTISLFVM